MGTPWFVETIDLYFGRDYRAKYDDVMKRLRQRGVVKIVDGRMVTTVKP